jgi:hypothetical protein
MTKLNDLKFDIYAMVKPKSPEDIIALCHEALSELGEINQVLDEILGKD